MPDYYWYEGVSFEDNYGAFKAKSCRSTLKLIEEAVQNNQPSHKFKLIEN